MRLPDRLGFRGKTLWDWLQLLIVPAILIGVTFAWSATQTRTDDKREDRRSQDATLQAYLDQMSRLMLDKGLLSSKEDDAVRAVARTVSLTALRRLDRARRSEVVRFLSEAKLLTSGNGSAPVSLEVADLGSVDLSGAKLRHANFRNANLTFADLRRANLRDADLYGADLSGANLGGADLDGVDLRRANLRDADLWEANLREAKLFPADLRGADLTRANLTFADLRNANLGGADLSEANLRGADLRNANLRGAKLEFAEFKGADLRGARLDPDSYISGEDS